MATLTAAPPANVDRFGSSAAANISTSARIATAQTGTGPSTHIADRGNALGPDLVQIVTSIGATPTATMTLEGSADGTTWFTIPSAADPIATPALTAFTITTATTTRRFIPSNVPARYLRLNISANTNVTFDLVDVFVF
jgi:hypothetical protein